MQASELLWPSNSRLTKLEPRAFDAITLHFVHRDEFDRADAFWKVPRDDFVIDDEIAHRRAAEEPCVQIGLLQANALSRAHSRSADREWRIRKIKLLNIVGVGRHERVNVSRVVGIQLTLYDGYGIKRLRHACGLRKLNVNSGQRPANRCGNRHAFIRSTIHKHMHEKARRARLSVGRIVCAEQAHFVAH
jgi:hypothetical protein